MEVASHGPKSTPASEHLAAWKAARRVRVLLAACKTLAKHRRTSTARTRACLALRSVSGLIRTVATPARAATRRAHRAAERRPTAQGLCCFALRAAPRRDAADRARVAAARRRNTKQRAAPLLPGDAAATPHTMNPWGQPQQPYNPAMAAYYQQQQQAAYGAYPQQQYQAQPQYQPVPGYPPQPQYPHAQPGYAYPPQQTYGAALAYYPQPVVPAAPVAAPPAPPAPAPAPVAVELPEGAKAPMNVFVGKLPFDVHESCVEALLKQCGGVLKWKSGRQ